MTERRSFYRKVGYLVAIAVLCFPVYVLSHPASLEADGARMSGGLLARLRDEHQLSQATLGDIDPTSETMKFATLGLRGLAVQLLWNSLHHYQMTEDYNSVSAVVEQIRRLQPNFWSVWDFQSHNLSYNISVEFDDYRDRFYWVMKGIDFLKQGVKYNSTDPRFLARVGWVHGNKIGRADERVQYRRLFRQLQEEKGEPLTDNWLVANDWYTRAQELVDSGRPLRVYIGGEQEKLRNKPGERAPSPLLFHSEGAMALINYADNLEEEGTFGEVAKEAWKKASDRWTGYANRDLSTPYAYSVRLNDMEQIRSQIEEHERQLEKLLPGEREKVREIKRAKLTEDERRALDKPPQLRSAEENNAAVQAEFKTKVAWDEVALRAPQELRPEARRLASEIASLAEMASTIDTYRDIVNYYYWSARCQAEPTDACLLAREYLYQAGKAYDNGQLFEARDLYVKSFDEWRKVLDDYPVLRSNNIMADDLVDEIDKYKKVIGKIPGEKFPEKFVLQDMIDLNEGKQPPAAEPATPKETTPEPAKTKPAAKDV